MSCCSRYCITSVPCRIQFFLHAQALCGGDRLAMLLERAFQTRDELLFKVLRNLSQQSDLGIKGGFLPYMDQLAQLLHVRSSLLPCRNSRIC